jgi:hypothetical protein
MRRKYLRGAGIFYFRKRLVDSPLWSDIMQVKSLYLCGKRMHVGNGRMTRVCDAWCGHSPLKDKFPEIYNICREQNITVAAAAAMDWGFTFRRWMPHDHESIMHMFFECDAAKYFWSSVGQAVGAPTRFGSFSQFFS